MILTPSDVGSLTTTLSYWEVAEYCFGGLVAVACLGEYAADFTKWFTRGVEERKKRLAKRSKLLLIASLALELICLVRTNQISGRVIGSLDEKAERASQKSAQAIIDADTATGKAKAASGESGTAMIEAGKAKDAAGNAELLARGARKEADSFEADIKSARAQSGEAKTLAGEAKTLLTEVRQLAAAAQQRASEATAGVDRLKTPRSLNNIPELVAKLRKFENTEYTFSAVFADGESIDLLKSVDDVLRRAGWKRTKPPGGFPAINVYGKDQEFAVPSSLSTGVRMSADSQEELSALQALPVDKLPLPVGAAVSLYFGLSSSIVPRNTENLRPVNMVKGDSKTVRIEIGKKP